jgi:lipid II:glycine glycyltransferase (peptidoglycan interpeptide bridge formation enzyme)
MRSHIVQSPEWGEFKTKYGTPAIRVGNIQYTVHKVPKTNFSYAYAPKINPLEIEWDPLVESLKENNCFTIKFDVPYVLAGSNEESSAIKFFEDKEGVERSAKSTFTQHNIILDISKSEDELMAGMHKKHRYNTRYAQKKGVTVRKAETDADFDIFLELQRETASNQKFLVHPDDYYRKIWEVFGAKSMVHLLIAEHEGDALAAWLFFVYERVLYYPYGGSSTKKRNLFASNLISWEGIKLGKSLGCDLFDMWGACADPNDESDPDWGFTNFKIRFGGEHVKYMDSYELVLNETLNTLFNFAYPKVLKLLKIIK